MVNATIWNLEGVTGRTDLSFTITGIDLEPTITMNMMEGNWIDRYPMGTWDQGDIGPVLVVDWGSQPEKGDFGTMTLKLEYPDIDERDFTLSATSTGSGHAPVTNTIEHT